MVSVQNRSCAKRCSRLCWFAWREEQGLDTLTLPITSVSGSTVEVGQTTLSDRLREIEDRCEKLIVLKPPKSCEDFFQLGDVLGEGGFGKVYRATLTSQGKRTCSWLEVDHVYAVKRIENSGRGSSELIRRTMLVSAERHVDYFRSLTNQACAESNIIQIFAQIFDIPNSISVVLEVLEGPDMLDWIQSCKSPIMERDIANMAKQMFTAIHYLHWIIGALHRDIKPDNFGFCKPVKIGGLLPALKLFDFGVSLVLPDPVNTTTELKLLDAKPCGTLLYMAPEVFDGKCGPPSDVWGVGLILYYLLCRDLPFDLLTYNSKRGTIRGLRRNKLTFDDAEASVGARQFVTAILQKDPSCRSSTRTVLSNHWLVNAQRSPCSSPRPERMLKVSPSQTATIWRASTGCI